MLNYPRLLRLFYLNVYPSPSPTTPTDSPIRRADGVNQLPVTHPFEDELDPIHVEPHVGEMTEKRMKMDPRREEQGLHFNLQNLNKSTSV